MTTIKKRLEKCFAVAFMDLSKDEIPIASVSSVSAWDSLATMTLASLVEEEFGIEIPADGSVDFISFDVIHDYLRSRDESVEG